SGAEVAHRGEMCERWRGAHAEAMHVGAHRHRAGRNRRPEHIAGSPRVLADQQVATGAVGQTRGGGTAEVVCHSGCELNVGNATDPVCAEEPRQGSLIGGMGGTGAASTVIDTLFGVIETMSRPGGGVNDTGT